ncbi:glutathione S-transferase [Microdochium nivale]|nr:glutathione S-transferase [Microdochium nivale]
MFDRPARTWELLIYKPTSSSHRAYMGRHISTTSPSHPPTIANQNSSTSNLKTANMAATAPPIKLYTNHGCPWAQRAEIILAELNIPHEQEVVDLRTPRTAEYLAINPRGLVPTLAYGDEIIAESGIIAQFIADLHGPSHLLPASTSAEGALRRARINFFVDTFVSKLGPHFTSLQFAKPGVDLDAAARGYVDNAAKELEPLLADAASFFGGSDKPTFAEVQTGSFIIRFFTLTKAGLIADFRGDLEAKAPNFYRWASAVAEIPSVKSTFPADEFSEMIKFAREKFAAQAKAA